MIQFDYASLDLFSQNKEYKLSSVLGEDNFFYGLFDHGTGKLEKARFITGLPSCYWNDLDFLRKLFKDEGLLNRKIIRSAHAVSNAGFSLVPTAIQLSNPGVIEESLEPKFHNENFEFVNQHLAKSSIDFHYYRPSALSEYLNNNFEGVSICHLNAALIAALDELKLKKFILFNFLVNEFQTVVFKNGHLVQTNHYHLSGAHDAVYYALLNCKQNDFDPLNDQFYMSGPFPEEMVNKLLFYQHFKYLDGIGDQNRLNYSNVFLGKAKHMFFDLQSVLKCES